MRSERICALSRFAMSLTAQRRADDGRAVDGAHARRQCKRRLSLPQSFLAIDAVLTLCRNVAEGLVVYPKVIDKQLREELPFMATEEILMAAVRAGGDRQELHERIRVHSQAAARQIKEHGQPNDLIARLQSDPAFEQVDMTSTLDTKRYIGRSPQQSRSVHPPK